MDSTSCLVEMTVENEKIDLIYGYVFVSFDEDICIVFFYENFSVELSRLTFSSIDANDFAEDRYENLRRTNSNYWLLKYRISTKK